MGRGYGEARAAVLRVLAEFGEPMSVDEINELLPDIPRGTIGGIMAKGERSGVVRGIRGRSPYRWFVPREGYVPQLLKGEFITEPYVPDGETVTGSSSQEVAVREDDPWDKVRRQWFVVFGVTVTADDARLMVELAAREVRNVR